MMNRLQLTQEPLQRQAYLAAFGHREDSRLENLLGVAGDLGADDALEGLAGEQLVDEVGRAVARVIRQVRGRDRPRLGRLAVARAGGDEKVARAGNRDPSV